MGASPPFQSGDNRPSKLDYEVPTPTAKTSGGCLPVLGAVFYVLGGLGVVYMVFILIMSQLPLPYVPVPPWSEVILIETVATAITGMFFWIGWTLRRK